MGGRLLDPTGVALRGEYQDITVPPPAAGHEWSYTFPAGSWYRVGLAYFRLVTSPELEERKPNIELRDNDGLRRARIIGGLTTGESQEADVTAFLGGSPSAFLSTVAGNPGLPLVWLPGGWSIGTSTVHLKAKDQYDRIRLWLLAVDDDEPGDAPGVDLPPDLHWSSLGGYAA